MKLSNRGLYICVCLVSLMMSACISVKSDDSRLVGRWVCLLPYDKAGEIHNEERVVADEYSFERNGDLTISRFIVNIGKSGCTERKVIVLEGDWEVIGDAMMTIRADRVFFDKEASLPFLNSNNGTDALPFSRSVHYPEDTTGSKGYRHVLPYFIDHETGKMTMKRPYMSLLAISSTLIKTDKSVTELVDSIVEKSRKANAKNQLQRVTTD